MRTTTKFIIERLFLLAFSAVIFAPGVRAQESSINLTLARKYFVEVEALCRQDQGRLWGVSLCGPILFVDVKTRAVVANRGDRMGLLARTEELYVGKWPVEMNISNTAVEWAGTRWTMVMWPLPTDPQERAQLMAHESFHRVQDQLGLLGSNPSNSHLDTREGRIWLQLEWRALATALMERGALRRQAIMDALIFRAYRHHLFPQAAAEEKALELNEGLAEYTGLKLSSSSSVELALRAGCSLRQAHFRSTFVRSFAYASGPAYGVLLDESDSGWRQSIRRSGDLGARLMKTDSINLPKISRGAAIKRAQSYNGEALIAAETERDNARQVLLAKYRARFLEQPVLVLPLTEKVQYSFNPNNLVPLDERGTIYPTLRVSDEWGVLEVTDGALVIREQGRMSRVLVEATHNLQERPLKGPGWALQLIEGWEWVPDIRKGNLILKRKADPTGAGAESP